MAELLIKAVDHTHPDAEKDRQGAYKKGDIVVVMPDGHEWGSNETLPKFVVVKVPGLDHETILDRAEMWESIADFEQIAYSAAQDGYRLRVFGTVPGASNEAGITKAKAESYINSWGGTVFSFGPNEVVFDIGVYNAVASEGFWDRDLTDFVFGEISYDQPSKVHRIRAVYSATPFPGEQVAKHIELAGGVNLIDSGTAIDFDIESSIVREMFKRDLADRLRDIYKRRRYSFSEADVDIAIGLGGEVTLTVQQLSNRLIDWAT